VKQSKFALFIFILFYFPTQKPLEGFKGAEAPIKSRRRNPPALTQTEHETKKQKRKTYRTNRQKMKNKTTKMFIGMLALGMLLLLSISFASADSAIYSSSAEYSPSSHTYNIDSSYVGSVSIDVKGTSNGESDCMTFNYADGSSYTGPCQSVPYISWSTQTFSNPNTSLQVTSLTLKGGTHTYIENLYVYAYTGNISGTGDNTGNNGNNIGNSSQPYCGDGKINGNETCDTGSMNGFVCNASYGSSCTYCSSTCQTKTVIGPHCGDGIVNGDERCDDGNTNNNDKCTNECKKPFEVTVEGFVPEVWQCDHRVVMDDATEPGRVSGDGQTLVERINNYAFEGEQIQWEVLVMDKNGIEDVNDVYATVDGNREANCERLPDPLNIGSVTTDSVTSRTLIDPSCNSKIDEENITQFDSSTMAYYLCTLTVETPESQNDAFYGKKDITVEAEDMDGQLGTMAEGENWFFNPVIQLSVDGSISFDNIRPGTSSYSGMVKVGNDADAGSGVLLDMFISGTDFYDSSSSGALCPTTNQLSLSNFAYYTSNGAYSTAQDSQIGRTCDEEGYCQINYGIGFNDPKPFYNRNEILQANKVGPYYTANLLSPGSEMPIIFRLNLPESCNGNFDTGQIYFWGEAI
jgi:cysteine-rich repeat protein